MSTNAKAKLGGLVAELALQGRDAEADALAALLYRPFPDAGGVVEALERDAARYRWLRCGRAYEPEAWGIAGGRTLDEAIDVEIAALASLSPRAGEEGDQGVSSSVAGLPSAASSGPITEAEQSGWGDISTAPKDGTWFLAWGDGQEWDDCTFVCEWSGDEWRQVPGDLDADPVCWMPLPEPPTPSGGQAVVPDPTGLVRDEPSPKAPAKLEGDQTP